MIQAKCIEKIRDKNNIIVAYKLQDTQGNNTTISAQQLKQAIKENQINVANLKLTSDNRIINRIRVFKESIKPNRTSVTLKREHIIHLNNQNNKSLSFKIKANLSNLLKKSQLLGYTIQKLEDHLYLIESNTQLIIATDLDRISLPADCSSIFEWSLLKSIDSTNIDITNVTDMSYMFSECKAQQLDLSRFNTKNVTNMSWMFCDCQAQHLDLSIFNTKNVTNMSNMFWGCKAQKLDLSSFNTKNVTNMSYMFYDCQAQHLDLSSFNTKNVTNMSGIFNECQAKKITVNKKGVENMLSNKEVFRGCNAQIEIKE